MEAFRVAIDVGHADGSGARGNGLEEHAMCAMIAAEVKRHLESFTLQRFVADVLDFPSLGNSADLVATAKAVNAEAYDVCVSMHMDASENEAARGAHVCYVSAKGKKLAKEIALRLCGQLPGRAQQVVQRTDLYILRKTEAVAVLVECGFITNEGDADWVRHHVTEVARAIALGIAAYFEL